jgi:methylated-DNA-[protein]-cysteine S-methyltransferase
MDDVHFTYLETPIGRLLLAASAAGLLRVSFPSGTRARGPEPGWTESDEWLADPARQLAEYFAGERRIFDLRLAPRGTSFQRLVWAALAEIPYGETRSYGDLARRIGRPAASRAVGAANGRNPLPIVLPCHRVVGTDGSLTGFGGGLAVKRALLALEQAAGGTAAGALL